MTGDSVTRLAEKIYNALYYRMDEGWDDEDRAKIELLLREAMEQSEKDLVDREVPKLKQAIWDAKQYAYTRAAQVARNEMQKASRDAMGHYEACAAIAAAIERLREDK